MHLEVCLTDSTDPAFLVSCQHRMAEEGTPAAAPSSDPVLALAQKALEERRLLDVETRAQRRLKEVQANVLSAHHMHSPPHKKEHTPQAPCNR